MNLVDGRNLDQTPIKDILDRLPDDIQRWARSNIVFFVPENWSAGSAVTHCFVEPTSQLRLVYLPPESHLWSRRMREAAVVHHIAHHWSPEENAGDQATTWGFGEGIDELKSRGWLEPSRSGKSDRLIM